MTINTKWTKRLQSIRRIIWTGARLLILAYAIWVLVYLVGRLWIPGNDHGFIAASHNLTPWFGPIGLVLLIMALFSRWRWPLVAALAPGLIAFTLWYGPLLLPPPTGDPPPGSYVLHVTSFNILSPRSDPERIAEAIRDLGEMDIVGLLEVGPDHAARIEADLSDRYPHRLLFPRQPTYAGIGLLSRYPIVSHQIYQPEPDSLLHLRAELDVEGNPVIVYVIHPRPPEHRLNPFRYDNGHRKTEIQDTLRRVKQENGPVLLLCDCNMPDQSVDHDAMDAVLDDAFREAGWGLGLTFPAYRPFIPSLIRIDYVWFNDYFVALSAETAADPGTSDHRPIQTELALKPIAVNKENSDEQR